VVFCVFLSVLLHCGDEDVDQKKEGGREEGLRPNIQCLWIRNHVLDVATCACSGAGLPCAFQFLIVRVLVLSSFRRHHRGRRNPVWCTCAQRLRIQSHTLGGSRKKSKKKKADWEEESGEVGKSQLQEYVH